MRKLIWCSFGLVGLMAVLSFLSFGAQDDAKSMVVRAMKYADGLDSISMSMNMTMAIHYPGAAVDETVQFDGELSIRGEKEFYMSVGMPTESAAILSDGKQQVIYMRHEKTYMTEPAPISRVQALGMMPGPPASEVSLFLSRFLHNDGTLLSGVGDFELIGEEAVSVRDAEGEVSEVLCNHIRFRLAPSVVDLWIQKKSKPLLHMIKMDMTSMFSGQPGGPDKVAVTYAFSGVEPNAKLADSRFTFAPPPGVREIKPNQDPMLGMVAPDVELELLGGGRFKLSSHKGKEVVMLDFWATWCGPCRLGMPAISEVAKEYKDKGVVLYAVNQGESRELAESYLASSGLDLVVARDPKYVASQLYKVSGIPRTVIIGKDGIIHSAHNGIPSDINYYKQQLRSELDAALLVEVPSGSE